MNQEIPSISYLMDMSLKKYHKTQDSSCSYIIQTKKCSHPALDIWELFWMELTRIEPNISQPCKWFSMLLINSLLWNFLKMPSPKPSKLVKFLMLQNRRLQWKLTDNNWERKRKISWDKKKHGWKAFPQISKREKIKKENVSSSTRW